MNVGNVIDTLISIKDYFRADLTSDQIIAINNACNIIESYFGLQEDAEKLIERRKE